MYNPHSKYSKKKKINTRTNKITSCTEQTLTFLVYDFRSKALASVISCNVSSNTQYSITTDVLFAPFNNVQMPQREEPQSHK